jgi:ATP-dependent helicase HrpB
MTSQPGETEGPEGQLPVREVIGELMARLAESPAVILRAPPGAGKTTLVPLALKRDLSLSGRIFVTQPRRLAARSAADRLCLLDRCEPGKEIGYQVRMERRWGRSTRVVVMTTGVLLNRLLHDPFLEGTSAIILDEFHERTIEMDVCLGMLIRLIDTVRPDLKVVVMSATIDCQPISAFLRGAPVIESPGRMFEVSIRYLPHFSNEPVHKLVADALPRALAATEGHLLVFLPGVGEIFNTASAIESIANKANARIWKLFGDMPLNDQNQVLKPAPGRKIILATNVAETSLTIDGVTGVIDSGLARTLRYSMETGLSRLVLESASIASADQRAGRAGRQQPGVCFRLWPESMNRARAAFDTPEILRGDLSGTLLQLNAMGESDYMAFPWLTRPADESVEQSRFVLEAIGAFEGNRITDRGRQMLRIPAEPRLARMLLASAGLGVVSRGALAAAMLSERDPFRIRRHAQSQGVRRPIDRKETRSHSDLVDRVARIEDILAGKGDDEADLNAIRQIARTALWLARQSGQSNADEGTDRREPDENEPPETEAFSPPGDRVADPDLALRRSIFEAYTDRLARRRQPGSDRGVMVGGTGVRLSAQSGVLDAELFVCIDVEHRERDSEVRMASAVDREWLDSDRIRVVDDYFFHPTQQNVQARRREYWFDLVIHETGTQANDPEAIFSILAEYVAKNRDKVFPADDPEITGFLQRLALVRATFPEEDWPVLDDVRLSDIARELCHGRRSLAEIRTAPWLDYMQALLPGDKQSRLGQLAPSHWTAPSGNRHSIEYGGDGKPRMRVKLQELFGLPSTPRVLGGRIPILLELLGPNQRPQQLTDDLASFWKNTYPIVRKELKRRYPKHHWPEDPLATNATRSGLKRDAES